MKISKTKLPLIALVALVMSCKEPGQKFVQELIASHPEREISAIWRFRLYGETVYYVQSACCDMYNQLYDRKGEYICSPDGGFTGEGDGKCPTFWSNAKHRAVIWEAGTDHH